MQNLSCSTVMLFRTWGSPGAHVVLLKKPMGGTALAIREVSPSMDLNRGWKSPAR